MILHVGTDDAVPNVCVTRGRGISIQCYIIIVLKQCIVSTSECSYCSSMPCRSTDSSSSFLIKKEQNDDITFKTKRESGD